MKNYRVAFHDKEFTVSAAKMGYKFDADGLIVVFRGQNN